MTLTSEPDLDSFKVNRYAEYLGQRLFNSIVIVHTHRHTHRSDCCTWTTKVVGKIASCNTGARSAGSDTPPPWTQPPAAATYANKARPRRPTPAAAAAARIRPPDDDKVCTRKHLSGASWWLRQEARDGRYQWRNAAAYIQSVWCLYVYANDELVCYVGYTFDW